MRYRLTSTNRGVDRYSHGQRHAKWPHARAQHNLENQLQNVVKPWYRRSSSRTVDRHFAIVARKIDWRSASKYLSLKDDDWIDVEL